MDGGCWDMVDAVVAARSSSRISSLMSVSRERPPPLNPPLPNTLVCTLDDTMHISRCYK